LLLLSGLRGMYAGRIFTLVQVEWRYTARTCQLGPDAGC
jgi:hypothetical protein